MKRAIVGIALGFVVAGSAVSAAQTPTPATAAVEVTECAQAQMVVDRLLEGANMRIEAARQTNSAAEMRAAVEGLQATLRDVRAQLAPCAKVQPSDLHGPHVMPKPPMTSGTAPAIPVAAPSKPSAPPDPHAGHTAPAPPSAKPAAERAPSAAKPAPAAKPAASDPHAGHAPAPAKSARPAPKSAPSPAKPAPKPPASDPHAGHAPATPTAPAQPPPKSPAEAVDPVCGLKVDPATAPKATVQGRTYFFCSDQHQQLFQKNPAKYLPRGQ